MARRRTDPRVTESKEPAPRNTLSIRLLPQTPPQSGMQPHSAQPIPELLLNFPPVNQGFNPQYPAGIPSMLQAAGVSPVTGFQGVPLKVTANSKPQSVAGKISHITRSGEAPTICAMGASSINQTVKSIAIARTYLERDEIDLMCFPKFHRSAAQISGIQGGSIAFELQKSVLRRRELESTLEMKVAQTSKPGRIAGAIAGQIRAGERVSLVTIGPGSVSQTVKAIVIARRHLGEGQHGSNDREPTPGGIDVSFRPEFIHIPYDDAGRQKQRSAIKFKLFAQQMTAPKNHY